MMAPCCDRRQAQRSEVTGTLETGSSHLTQMSRNDTHIDTHGYGCRLWLGTTTERRRQQVCVCVCV